MSLSHKNVVVNSITSTMLTIPSSEEDQYSKSLSITIQNLDETISVYLGDESVSTSSYGFRLDPYATYSADLLTRDEIYSVSAEGQVNLAIILVKH